MLSAAFAALSFGTSADPAAAIAGPPMYSWLKLINYNSGQCLAVGGASTAGGAGIIQWTCVVGAAEQKWEFLPSQWADWYQIVNLNSGKCLAISSSQAHQQGAQAIQYGCDNLYDQAWWFSENTLTGRFTLQNMMSGMVIAVGGSSLTPGAPVVQWTSTGGNEQKWTAST